MAEFERVDAFVAGTLTRFDVPYGDVTRAVRLAEFAAVGASGAVVNLLVFLAVSSRVAPLAAGFVGFFSGVLWTFALNWTVTFRGVTGRVGRRFLRYVAVCCVGYVIYEAALAVTLAAVDLPLWLAGLTAVTAAGAWNFLGSERFALA